MRNTPNRHLGIINGIPEGSTTSRDADYLDSLLIRSGVRRPECSADAMAANASVKERSAIALDIFTLHIYTCLTQYWPLSCVACCMVPGIGTQDSTAAMARESAPQGKSCLGGSAFISPCALCRSHSLSVCPCALYALAMHTYLKTRAICAKHLKSAFDIGSVVTGCRDDDIRVALLLVYAASTY